MIPLMYIFMIGTLTVPIIGTLFKKITVVCIGFVFVLLFTDLSLEFGGRIIKAADAWESMSTSDIVLAAVDDSDVFQSATDLVIVGKTDSYAIYAYSNDDAALMYKISPDINTGDVRFALTEVVWNDTHISYNQWLQEENYRVISD